MPRVLIVDDEAMNLNALERFLKRENSNWEIFTAANKTAGLAAIKEHIGKSQPIDLVLTDLWMETERAGMELLGEARKLDPSLMGILFTGKTITDRLAAFTNGASDVVDKNSPGSDPHRELNLKAREALRLREAVRQIGFLRRYFDPRVFEIIERDQSVLNMQSRLITICFWDIRGFSGLCENLKARPDLIAGFLKDYCEIGAQTIFEHSGVLDKFIGDGIMALFGVLEPRDDNGKSDALNAVRAAINLRERFKAVYAKWKPDWEAATFLDTEIGLGCGIHTGQVLVGNVGTDFRDQFTALGTDVNVAARIEHEAKDGLILLSQSTNVKVNEQILTSEKGIVEVHNIQGKIKVFSAESERTARVS